jgi:hypothetical protein
MDIIVLTGGPIESEFEMQAKYRRIFGKHLLNEGRMISGSKSGYWERHKENLIVFNANIVTEKSGKVWFGDLDVTLDFDKLKDAANELGEDLYILRESDARFGSEKDPVNVLMKKAVAVINCK